MESFHKYKQAGINMTLGTDTCPQNMIQAMRWAAVISKVMERDTQSTTAADVFNAATLAGARALGEKTWDGCAPEQRQTLSFFPAIP